MTYASRILVVDDSPNNLGFMVETLVANDLQARPAEGGECALAVVENWLPDLMLLAVHMAGLDGFEVCRRLKRHPATRDIPVLFLSEVADSAERAQGFASGAVDFISGPCDTSELLVKVRTHLELVRLRSELERQKTAESLDLRKAGEQLCERAVTEAALRESERNIRLVADYTYDWEWMVDPAGIFTYSSPSCFRITGYRPQEIPNLQALERIIHAEDLALWRAHEGVAKGCAQPGEVEFRIHHREGSIRWIAHVCQPVREEGCYRGQRGSNRDITRSREAEQRLRAADERLSLAQRASQSGMWDWDMPSGRLSWSREMFLLLGLPAEGVEATFEVWHNLLHPEDRAAAAARIEASIRDHVPLFNEYRIIKSSGETCHIQAFGDTLYSPEETPLRMSGICIDVTQLRQAEEARRASDARYSQLFRNMGEGFAYCRMLFEEGLPADWIYLEVNPSFEHLVGLRDVLGKRVTELIPGIREANPELFELYGRVARGRIPESFETYVPGLDNWFSISVFCPEPDHFVAIFQVITERKRAEAALRVSEERFRSWFELPLIGICITSPEKGWLEVNDRACDILGHGREELAGTSWAEITHPEDLPADVAQFERVARGEIEGYALEKRFLRKDGRVVPVELAVRCVRRPDGSLAYFIALFQDISERKRTEAERQQLADRMNQVQKLEALGVLVAGVAHNVNNILTAIMGAASLRERLAMDPKDLEAYRVITMACRRGRDVVKSLTQFAQPSLSNQSPLDVHALITEVRTLLENTTRNRISIHEAFSAEPLWTTGDAGNLNHALVNLCLNALDAMPNGGTLVFRTTALGPDWLALAVEDDGEGMTPEILARVTEPFFTTKPVGKGTGLGLSMTHGVVKAHGGTLEIRSVPGRGTTVTFRLPRIPMPDRERTAAAPAAIPNALRVLLVDDDQDVRFLVARMLNATGMKIATVGGGQEALDAIRSGDLPDLIILDQNMPQMDGIQTMHRIRALHPEMPILISSGQPDIQEWPCFKQPNVDVISKPFELDELLSKLAQFRVGLQQLPRD